MEVEKCERCQTVYSGKTTCNECKTHLCERCNNQWHFRGEKRIPGHDSWCEKVQPIVVHFQRATCNSSMDCNSALHLPSCPIFQRVMQSMTNK